MTPLVRLPETDADERLTLDQSIRLKQLEASIERDSMSFEAVGRALAEIRDDGLYRSYRTFKEYTELRWSLSETRVYELIDCAKVVKKLRNCGVKLPRFPSNEAQCRPLSSLEPEAQVEVWQKACDTATGGVLTARHIAETVRQYKGGSGPSEPAPWTLHDAIDHLGRRLYEISQRWPQEHIAVMARQLHDLADELQQNGELCP